MSEHAFNLKTRFFPDMQFSQNDIANYEASVKAQKVILPSLKCQIFCFWSTGPNLSLLPNNLDNKFNFPNPTLLLFNIYGKISYCKKSRKPTRKNAPLADGKADRWTDEEDWFYKTPSTKMEVRSCFSEIQEWNFLKLFGLIVTHMERIKARKRNTINIVQGSKSSKSMILSKFT